MVNKGQRYEAINAINLYQSHTQKNFRQKINRNKCCCPKETIARIYYNNQCYSEPQKIAAEFNNYFLEQIAFNDNGDRSFQTQYLYIKQQLETL